MSEKAAELLRRHEGFRPKPYKGTAGKLTIVYGRNLDDRGISRAEADFLLQNDINEAVANLRLEPYWLDAKLGETRQAVLIDLCVNLGWPLFALFKKMRAALKAQDYQAAADQLEDSNWYDQVGNRGPELVNLMRHGWA